MRCSFSATNKTRNRALPGQVPRAVNADLAENGTYLMFIQFQTDGTLHTAAVTVSAD
jgi:hypothetical protein